MCSDTDHIYFLNHGMRPSLTGIILGIIWVHWVRLLSELGWFCASDFWKTKRNLCMNSVLTSSQTADKMHFFPMVAILKNDFFSIVTILRKWKFWVIFCRWHTSKHPPRSGWNFSTKTRTAINQWDFRFETVDGLQLLGAGRERTVGDAQFSCPAQCRTLSLSQFSFSSIFFIHFFHSFFSIHFWNVLSVFPFSDFLPPLTVVILNHLTKFAFNLASVFWGNFSSMLSSYVSWVLIIGRRRTMR